jgi:hypothetical protein
LAASDESTDGGIHEPADVMFRWAIFTTWFSVSSSDLRHKYCFPGYLYKPLNRDYGPLLSSFPLGRSYILSAILSGEIFNNIRGLFPGLKATFEVMGAMYEREYIFTFATRERLSGKW